MHQADSELVMAPVSRQVAKLLHQLQAQIIKEAGRAACTSAPDPMGALQNPSRHDHRDGDQITYKGDNGEDEFLRRRECPACWVAPTYSVPWHPSHWRLTETRNAAGRRWSTAGGSGSVIHVVDDFGTLVPLPKHLQ